MVFALTLQKRWKNTLIRVRTKQTYLLNLVSALLSCLSCRFSSLLYWSCFYFIPYRGDRTNHCLSNFNFFLAFDIGIREVKKINEGAVFFFVLLGGGGGGHFLSFDVVECYSLHIYCLQWITCCCPHQQCIHVGIVSDSVPTIFFFG